MKHTRNRFAILFGLVLFLFTGYLLADTFLIPRTYAVVPDEGGTATAAAQVTAAPEAVEIATEAAASTRTTRPTGSSGPKPCGKELRAAMRPASGGITAAPTACWTPPSMWRTYGCRPLII